MATPIDARVQLRLGRATPAFSRVRGELDFGSEMADARKFERASNCIGDALQAYRSRLTVRGAALLPAWSDGRTKDRAFPVHLGRDLTKMPAHFSSGSDGREWIGRRAMRELE